jgi:hypothetical protein
MNFLRTISVMRFVVMLTILASCGVTDENQRDDPESTEVTAGTVSPAAPELAVPPSLQLITPDVTCAGNRSGGGVCTGSALCRGSGGVPVAGSCPTGKVCCSQCAAMGGVCTGSALCRGSGGHTVNAPCHSTDICCVQ